MKLPPVIISLLLTFFLFSNGFCQVNNQDYNTGLRNFFNKDQSLGSDNNFFLDVENSNFFKNNEYFNGFYNGKTLIGYYIKPEINYRPSDNILFRAGGYFLKYSGIDKYSRVIPTSANARSANSLIEVVTPVASKKSSGFSC